MLSNLLNSTVSLLTSGLNSSSSSAANSSAANQAASTSAQASEDTSAAVADNGGVIFDVTQPSTEAETANSGASSTNPGGGGASGVAATGQAAVPGDATPSSAVRDDNPTVAENEETRARLHAINQQNRERLLDLIDVTYTKDNQLIRVVDKESGAGVVSANEASAPPMLKYAERA